MKKTLLYTSSLFAVAFLVGPSFCHAATVSALVVAGGGAGGSFSGGGGAGGLIYSSSVTVSTQAYSVTVGAGGVPHVGVDTGVPGGNGSNSSFASLTATGGGGGGSRGPYPSAGPGSAGGSGGGGGPADGGTMGVGGSGVVGQGHSGGNETSSGWGGAGGGGAGSAGGNTGGNNGANGGDGIANSISGSSVYYAGGGAGGSYSNNPVGSGGLGGGGAGSSVGDGTNGTANTGGGGGGSGYPATGGVGGSGIVIISAPAGSITATGGTRTVVGGNDIWTFTSSGTWTVTSVSSNQSSATMTGSLNGYGWSDNIGWVSFNCLTGSPTANSICTTSNYAVGEDASGNLSGYAWSDNVGWIQFGGLTGFPNTTTGSNAKVDTTSGSLTGWARALSANGNGWDGWISLSGITVDPIAGIFSGYGWGADVIGWLSLNLKGSGTCDPVHEVCFTINPVPSVVLSVNPTTMATSSTATALLSWTNTNIDITKACTISGSLTATVSAGVTSYTIPAGSFTTVGTRNYTVTCTATSLAGGGSTPSNPVALTVTGTTSIVNPGSCPSIPNATYCGGTGSVSAILTGHMCPASSSSYSPNTCEYVCNVGFRKLGNTCVLDSTIQEN